MTVLCVRLLAWRLAGWLQADVGGFWRRTQPVAPWSLTCQLTAGTRAWNAAHATWVAGRNQNDAPGLPSGGIQYLAHPNGSLWVLAIDVCINSSRLVTERSLFFGVG